MTTVHTDALAPDVTKVSLLETVQAFPERIADSEIAAEAYLLFEARGGEHGHDVEDWLAAEALIRQRRLTGRNEA